MRTFLKEALVVAAHASSSECLTRLATSYQKLGSIRLVFRVVAVGCTCSAPARNATKNEAEHACNNHKCTMFPLPHSVYIFCCCSLKLPRATQSSSVQTHTKSVGTALCFRSCDLQARTPQSIQYKMTQLYRDAQFILRRAHCT